MNDLMYYHTYTTSKSPASPFWDTEYVGLNNLVCNSKLVEFTPVENIVGEYYLKRTRDSGDTWQTTHSSVYDITHKELYIVVQEDQSAEYKFGIT